MIGLHSNMHTVTLVLISTILAVIRASGHKGQAFQAVAHLWMGGLIGAWSVDRDGRLMVAVVVLSIIEVLCFLAFRLFIPVMASPTTKD